MSSRGTERRAAVVVIGLLALVPACDSSSAIAGVSPVVRWEYATRSLTELSGLDVGKLRASALMGTFDEAEREGAREQVSAADAKLVEALNALGRDGWEVAWIADGSVLLKRPLR